MEGHNAREGFAGSSANPELLELVFPNAHHPIFLIFMDFVDVGTHNNHSMGITLSLGL